MLDGDLSVTIAGKGTKNGIYCHSFAVTPLSHYDELANAWPAYWHSLANVQFVRRTLHVRSQHVMERSDTLTNVGVRRGFEHAQNFDEWPTNERYATHSLEVRSAIVRESFGIRYLCVEFARNTLGQNGKRVERSPNVWVTFFDRGSDALRATAKRIGNEYGRIQRIWRMADDHGTFF